jgi:hypothetical protein
MEAIKALLQLQIMISLIVMSVGLSNTCVQNKLTPIPSSGFNLPYVNIRKEEDDFIMNAIKKYKILWRNGKRKITIKFKK